MLIGQVYRYSSETDKKDPSIEFVDGLPNYFFHTYDANSTRQVVFQRGIHGISEEIGIDKIKRRPAIIISSSPHKAGTAQTPWQDEYASDYGYVRYYGDNKSAKTLPEMAQGNKILLEAFKVHSSPNKVDRENATPILFINRAVHEGRKKGNILFQGYGVIEAVELVTQYDSNGNYFTNYVFDMCVFSLKNEGGNFDWKWINSRRDGTLSLRETTKNAPLAWKRWVEKGSADLTLVRRKVSSLSIVKAKDQFLKKDSDLEKILHAIYTYFSNKNYVFELLALKVTQYVFEESGANFMPGWITQASSDRGMDFVARMDIGEGLSNVKTVILGQAKCEKIDVPTNGQHISRTVARLKRGWIGVYVTTSYYSANVQEEVIEDQYPIMLINGKKLAETVNKIIFRRDITITSYLTEIENQYKSFLKNRRPEEILNL